ncbi:hypothetical protein SNEBB_001032 [Seison nebaliae]|nr:hypothetical protein SNEBB_001032 [Seison nebaliae]
MNDEEQMPCHIEMSSSFEEEEREEPSSLLHADNETKNEDEMEENNDTKEFYMSDNISNDITPTLAAVKKIDKAIDQLIDVENEYNDDTMNGDKSTKYSLHANKTLKATEKLTDALKEYVVQPSFTNTNSSTTTTTTTTTSTTTEEEQTLDENETKNDDVFVKFEILLPDGASEETSNKIDILRHRDWITAVRDYANKVQNTEDNDEIDDEICSGELIIIQKNENKQIQVREDSGTTFINGIEGDILIKEIPGNVNMNGDTFEEDNVKHVENEQNQSHVAMNILGQAYAQNFNGNLQLKPYFKGLIVIKTVSSIKYYQKDL